MFVRSVRLVAAALAALALAVPAAHAAEAGCPAQPSAQTFLPWLDPAWYVQAPDGGLEARGEGWTLAGGAAVVKGNEPYYVGDSADHRSLSLPGGAQATTAPMCIGVEHPTLRFFVRNTGDPLATLQVSVVYRGLTGQWESLPIGLVAGGAEWTPTPVVPVIVNLLSLTGSQEVAFRFAPADGGGDWTIDDVYVDPYSK